MKQLSSPAPILLAALLASAAAQHTAATPLDASAFEKHVTFTVNSAVYAGGALQDFPVLVRLSSVSGFQFGDFATPADELRFADASGENLDYEIDTWDAASGKALVWVSLPTLTAGATLTAYWAPDSAATLPAVSPTAVWTRAGYVGVWHMNAQNQNGTYPDSTGLGASLESSGDTPPAPETSSPSPLGSAYYIVPEANKKILKVSAANASSWTFSQTGYTTECWIGNLSGEFHRIFCHADSSGNSKNSLALSPARIYQMVASWSNANWPAGTTQGTAWHHVTSVLAPSGGSFSSRLYENASRFLNGSQKAVDFTDSGMLVTARTDSKWRHWMDEIRVRQGESSDDWVSANYATQANAAFLTAGTIEVAGGIVAGATTVTATTWTTVAAEADFTVPASFGTVPVTATLSLDGTVVDTASATSVDDSDGTSTATFADLLPGQTYSVTFVAVPQGGTPAYSTAAAGTTPALGIVVDDVGDDFVTVSGDFTIPQSAVYGAAAVVVRSVGVLPTETRVAAGSAADGDLAPAGITVSGLDIDTDYEAWFEIERTDGTTAASEKASFTTTGYVAVDPASYGRSVTFRVAGYTGGSTLENFPVLVRLSSSTSGFDYADTASGGADLRFAVDGKRVPHEVGTWNSAGESLVWVSLPTLEANRYFTMYYAPKSGVEIPEADAPSRVWTKAGYIGVWHMDDFDGYGRFDDSAGVSGSIATATGEAGADAGPVGGYWSNPGSMVLPATVTEDWDFSESGVTFEAWMTPAKGSYRRMFANGTSWNSGVTMSIGATDYYIGSGNSTGGKANWATAGWNHMSFAYQSTSTTAANKSARAYDNGSSGAGTSVAKDITFENGFGLTSYINGNESMDGSVDEIRIRATASTADWAKATHDTMANENFIAVDRPQPDSIVASGVTATGATLAGTFYVPGGASVAVACTKVGSGVTNTTESVALAAGATDGAVPVTGLAPATDYVAWFVMNGEAFPDLVAAFTTDGSPALDISLFGSKANFTVADTLFPEGTEELENFPVLVRLSEERVPGFHYRQCRSADGSDLRFVDDTGHLLASDVENWDTAGESLVWVNLPECRAGTRFNMLYGARAGASLPSPQSSYVWTRAGYLGVWHMGKINADATLDSPVAGMDATTSLGAGYATPTTAARTVTRKWLEIGENSVATNSEEVAVAAPAGPYVVNNASVTLAASQTRGWEFSHDGATFEFWCVPNQGNGRLFASGTGWNASQNINVGNIDGGDKISVCCHQMWHWVENGSDRHFGDTAPSLVTPYSRATGETLHFGWEHMTVAYEANPTLEEQAVRYLNGEAWPRGTGSAASGTGISDFPTGMGLLGWVNGGDFFNGPVDELRVRQGVSSPEWAKAVYLSMAGVDPVVGYAPEGSLILIH